MSNLAPIGLILTLIATIVFVGFTAGWIVVVQLLIVWVVMAMIFTPLLAAIFRVGGDADGGRD